jgi:probable F420-dependent oxidoreductase
LKVRIAVAPGNIGTDPTMLGSFLDGLEHQGFDTVWLSEIPMGSLVDPLLGLSFAAGRTQKLKLGANVVPFGRSPYVLAKSLAQLDQLSAGRLLISLVPGLDQPGERKMLQIGSDKRGAYLNELIPLLRRWWSGEEVSYASERFTVDGVTLPTLPVQQPLEVWVGGVGPAAIERAGKLSDGWLGAALTPEESGVAVRKIAEVADRAGREIDDDHYGLSVPYFREPPSDHALAALRARRPDGELSDLAPVGSAQLRSLVTRLIDNGLSKFVVRPSSPVHDIDEELAWLAESVLDLQT